MLNAAALNAARAAAKINTSMRCLCGATGPRPLAGGQGAVVQCQGEACGVWQHTTCALHVPVVPPAGGAGKLLHPVFLCEVCRSARADPFWEVIANDILPLSLIRKTGKQVLVRRCHTAA